MCQNCVRSADGKSLTNFPDAASSPAIAWSVIPLPAEGLDFPRALEEYRRVLGGVTAYDYPLSPVEVQGLLDAGLVHAPVKS